MGSRVEGFDFAAYAHQRDKASLIDRFTETAVFLPRPACAQFLFGEGGNVGQRVVRAAFRLGGEETVQQRQVESHRLGLGRGWGGAVRVGEQAGGDTIIEKRQPAFVGFGADTV